ncbi:MAG: hypothetical protein LBR16_08335 [Treponema sp.]|nr:hypothetical protein [Treponema sp.]
MSAPSRRGALCCRALWITALALLGVLAGGTVYGLLAKRAPARDAAAAPAGAGSPMHSESVFRGIGTIRVRSPEPEAAAVVVTITFPYRSADTAFAEELALKTGELRSLARDFFASFRPAALRAQDEPALKAALLARFNAALRLGQIERLDFGDFLVLE